MNMTSRPLMIAVGVSLAVHLAAVAMSLQQRPELEVEGAGEVTHAVLGQSPFNTVLAGTVEQVATSEPVEAEPVEIEPVETAKAAEVVQPDKSLQPVDPLPLPQVTPPVPVETINPVPQAAVPATLALSATPARTFALPQVQRLETVTPPASDAVTPAEPDRTIVEAVPAQAREAVAATDARPLAPNRSVPETPAVAAKPVEAKPVAAEPVRQTVASQTPTQVVQAESDPVPTPLSKPPAPPRKKAEKKPAKSPSRTAKKPDARKTPAQVSSRGGSGGSAGVTAQKGGSQRKGKSKSAGNSDVTNYPAKVHRKLVRAVRAPRGGRKARSRAVVHFTIRRNGAVANIRLARSSGSGPFDQAVLKAVQRAAPFPPIPAAAGKSSWSFTLPVTLR